MSKKILLTGATDGIGLATAKILVEKGHHVLLHGRSSDKLTKVEADLSEIGKVESYICDLSNLADVKKMAERIREDHDQIDVLINNAGVLKTSNPKTAEGFDLRFVVNAFAPMVLTQNLLSIMNPKGRILNLSSAAQAPVSLDALKGSGELAELEAYAQSKLAITMWSYQLSLDLKKDGPSVIAVNPGSLLASKMVKEGFGVDGKDIGIGAGILVRLALDSEFEDLTVKYFDNDAEKFADPHPDGFDESKSAEVVQTIKEIIGQYLG